MNIPLGTQSDRDRIEWSIHYIFTTVIFWSFNALLSGSYGISAVGIAPLVFLLPGSLATMIFGWPLLLYFKRANWPHICFCILTGSLIFFSGSNPKLIILSLPFSLLYIPIFSVTSLLTLPFLFYFSKKQAAWWVRSLAMGVIFSAFYVDQCAIYGKSALPVCYHTILASFSIGFIFGAINGPTSFRYPMWLQKLIYGMCLFAAIVIMIRWL